jgi:hypothetical protein
MKILRTVGAVLLYWLAFVVIGPLTEYAWKLMTRWLGL